MFLNSNKIIVGIDEAGRGPLAGPVVAAAVLLDKSIEGLADSKQLTKAKREKLYQQIYYHGKVGVGIASVEEIDKINILQATILAMQRAYFELKIEADLVLVDGNKAPNLPAKEVKAIVDGDSLEKIISASSIIAKVTRDNIMGKLHIDYPFYLWDKNSGYGTKAHLEAMQQYGISEHHRKSFAPVKKILNPSLF